MIGGIIVVTVDGISEIVVRCGKIEVSNVLKEVEVIVGGSIDVSSIWLLVVVNVDSGKSVDEIMGMVEIGFMLVAKWKIMLKLCENYFRIKNNLVELSLLKELKENFWKFRTHF